MDLLKQAIDEEVVSMAPSTYRGLIDGTSVVGLGALQAASRMRNLESFVVAQDLGSSKKLKAKSSAKFSASADAMNSISLQDTLIKDCMACGIEVYFLPKSKIPEQLPLLGGLRDDFHRTLTHCNHSAYYSSLSNRNSHKVAVPEDYGSFTRTA